MEISLSAIILFFSKSNPNYQLFLLGSISSSSKLNMDLEDLYFSSDEEEDENRVRNPRMVRERVNFAVLNDFQYKEKFRLRRTEIQFVVDRLGPHLLTSDKNMALTPLQQLLVTFHWLGSGGAYHTVADMHGIGKSSVCRIVKRVVNACVDHLFQDVVRWPDNTANIAPEFLRMGGFPCVAGCVDGTIIKIDAPTINEEQYVDRHGNHSINAMMVCGPDYSFYAVNARWPGSVHDSRVFRTSNVSQRFENGWRPFPGALILGDSGYGLKSWLIPPYARNHEAHEVRFNQAHKRTRRIVENSYGILKERFPCLNYMRLNPSFAGKVIMACTTFHNIACKDDFQAFIEDPEDRDEPAHDFEDPNPGAQGRLQELLGFFR